MDDDAELGQIFRSGEAGSAILARGLAILHLLSLESGRTMKELSEASRIPLATTYRIVRQLVDSGFVTDQDGVIHAGYRMSVGADRGGQHLVTVAYPVLRELARATRLPAILTVRVHTLALCLDIARVDGGPSPAFRVGQTRPLYASASAAPLLAFSSGGLLDQVLRYPIRHFTSRTPDATTLVHQLQVIRENGYHFSQGELQAQWSGLGMPLVKGVEAVCCLSLAAPSHLLKSPEPYLPAMRRAIHDLTQRIDESTQSTMWSPTLHVASDLKEEFVHDIQQPAHR